jgi:hypothetical protein
LLAKSLPACAVGITTPAECLAGEPQRCYTKRDLLGTDLAYVLISSLVYTMFQKTTVPDILLFADDIVLMADNLENPCAHDCHSC